MPENSIRIFIALAALTLFGIITFALAAATLGTLIKRFNDVDNKLIMIASPTTNNSTTTNPTTTSSTTTSPTTTSPMTTSPMTANPTTISTSQPLPLNANLADTIRIDDLMYHLAQLEEIARQNNNTRAVGTTGFDKTVDYIETFLKNNSFGQLTTFRETLQVQNFTIQGSPILEWSTDDTNGTFTYSSTLSRADFTYVNYTAALNLTSFNVVVVNNNGCDESDYNNVEGEAILILAGGICTNAEKGEIATKKNVSVILFYNHGLTTTSLAPSTFRLRQSNQLPALSLSYAAGRTLVDAINKNNNNSVRVTIEIQRENYGTFSVDNICADLSDGNINETILVGGHSDSVPAGPGINDNGSGSSTNLVLAINLARLYGTTNYTKYRYRIRFCWWAAEEIGLVGAIHHVQQAQNSSALSQNKLSNYLINLNYDMLGSPNYFFGIYNGSSAKPGTPPQALNGSIRISEVFRDWFNLQNLPWDYTDFSGRSDYGPFLATGIVAGGLFSGADETKSVEQRDRYESKLGEGRGGLAGAKVDPCYHLDCDTIKNIDKFGYFKMSQAAAYMLEYLGRKNDLVNYLYPSGRSSQIRLSDDYFPNSDYFRET
ncbi:unnamed protein product [Adineta steineri]|uniref:Peptide hydrolase n=1 Tax=Adineta steineri TaxID=433720 RepID=A0A814ITX2_9BILA|nr:unnamed protein product [Adineta steineri]